MWKFNVQEVVGKSGEHPPYQIQPQSLKLLLQSHNTFQFLMNYDPWDQSHNSLKSLPSENPAHQILIAWKIDLSLQSHLYHSLSYINYLLWVKMAK